MLITKRSQLTGETHTWDIPVSAAAIARWKGGELIQDAMPHLTDDEREFIMTGITPKEWEKAYGD